MEMMLVVVLAVCLQAQAQHFQYFYTNPVVPVPQFGWQQPQTYIPKIPQHARFQEGEGLYQSQVPIQLPADNYRGYTYHTSFDDGASSTVVFFRGPLAPAPPVNYEQKSMLNRQTLASDSVDPRASQSDIEENIAIALNGRNQHLENTAFFGSSLSLIATMLEHPLQQNRIVHFFDQVPASTARLQQPSIQTSESVVSQYFPSNFLGYSDKNEHFPGYRQDKSLDNTVEIGARISKVTSKAPQQPSTTSGPQTTSSTESFTMSQDSDSINDSVLTFNISENSKGTNPSSTSSTTEESTSENVSDTTIAESTEESSTSASLKKADTSSSQTISPEGPQNEPISGQNTTIPNISITKNAGLTNSTTTDNTSKHAESTTTEESDLENTTKMIIVVV